jgi:hypothetical protein
MRAVGRDLKLLRAFPAMLCVALAMAFAGASAASVVDRVQHQTHVPHEHGLHLSLDVNGHADAHHAPSHHHNGDRDAGDHHPSPGHHHSHAPTGALMLPPLASAVVAAAGIVVPAPPEASRNGVRPGGLERPPKGAASLV